MRVINRTFREPLLSRMCCSVFLWSDVVPFIGVLSLFSFCFVQFSNNWTDLTFYKNRLSLPTCWIVLHSASKCSRALDDLWLAVSPWVLQPLLNNLLPLCRPIEKEKNSKLLNSFPGWTMRGPPPPVPDWHATVTCPTVTSGCRSRFSLVLRSPALPIYLPQTCRQLKRAGVGKKGSLEATARHFENKNTCCLPQGNI